MISSHTIKWNVPSLISNRLGLKITRAINVLIIGSNSSAENDLENKILFFTLYNFVLSEWQIFDSNYACRKRCARFFYSSLRCKRTVRITLIENIRIVLNERKSKFKDLIRIQDNILMIKTFSSNINHSDMCRLTL